MQTSTKKPNPTLANFLTSDSHESRNHDGTNYLRYLPDHKQSNVNELLKNRKNYSTRCIGKYRNSNMLTKVVRKTLLRWRNESKEKKARNVKKVLGTSRFHSQRQLTLWSTHNLHQLATWSKHPSRRAKPIYYYQNYQYHSSKETPKFIYTSPYQTTSFQNSKFTFM